MLTIDILEDDLFANTYIVKDEEVAIVIDPAADVRLITKLIDGRTLCYILLTHGHYDHFKTLKDLLKKYNVPVICHKNAVLKLANKDLSCASLFGENLEIGQNEVDYLLVNDQKNINFGNHQIKTIYTPGHTNCSLSFLIEDYIFTGDTLFNGGVGRWDLPTGVKCTLMISIKHLFKLPDALNVYPGHGVTTTIALEKRNKIYQIIFNH